MSIRNSGPEIKLPDFQTPETQLATEINQLREQIKYHDADIQQLKVVVSRQNEYINNLLQRQQAIEQWLQQARR
jgi:chromosome segregation ATPase